VVLAEVSGTSSPIRVAIVFWFMLVCPGMAFARLLCMRERLVELTLAIALSIALDTIVAETMALAKHWSPQWGIVTLAVLSVVGAVIQLTTRTGDAPVRDRQ
jgi:nucleoside recognition membrane protein YjiH